MSLLHFLWYDKKNCNDDAQLPIDKFQRLLHPTNCLGGALPTIFPPKRGNCFYFLIHFWNSANGHTCLPNRECTYWSPLQLDLLLLVFASVCLFGCPRNSAYVSGPIRAIFSPALLHRPFYKMLRADFRVSPLSPKIGSTKLLAMALR